MSQFLESENFYWSTFLDEIQNYRISVIPGFVPVGRVEMCHQEQKEQAFVTSTMPDIRIDF